MTSRHTITHADEMYAGNVYYSGYSPDGRRGVKLPYIHVYEYGAVEALDADGIVTSYIATGAYANMLTTIASGALVTGVNTATGDAVSFDVPRNVLLTACGDESSAPLAVHGTDVYGDYMVEVIIASGAGITSGVKAFKTVTKLVTTAAFATTVSIGQGNRLGLPVALTNKGKFLGLFVDGNLATASYTLVAMHATTAAPSSSQNDPDVRGTITPGTVPDGSKRFTIMMLFDGTTRNKTFGQAQATAVT